MFCLLVFDFGFHPSGAVPRYVLGFCMKNEHEIQRSPDVEGQPNTPTQQHQRNAS